MWKNKLVVNVSHKWPIPADEQIDLAARLGFDGFFISWKSDIPAEQMLSYRGKADEKGLLFQSVHAPFGKAGDLWTAGEAGDLAEKELMDCIDVCALIGVDLCVIHANKGFDRYYANPVGEKRLERVALKAKEKNVRIALENVEGDACLAGAMEYLRDFDNVGFCWDTGHEMCYNHSRDQLALYGDRLLCTHLNDNLGVRDPSGEITFYDDLHLLPFDGAADWQDIAARLVRHGYGGPLTFEIKWGTSVRGGSEPFYPYTFEQYMQHAYAAACRFAVLLEKERAKARFQ